MTKHIWPDSTARYVDGTTVVLTAVADASSSFTGWGGDCSGTAVTVTVTLTASKTCTAAFAPRVLTVTLAGGGAGTVTATGLTCQGTSCTGAYPVNTVVTMVAAPAAGSVFSGWSGDADCSDGSVTMTAARSCTATFTLLPSYPLTVQKTGSGSAGSTVTSTPGGIACGATCAASFAAGTSVQLTAVAASGFQFVRWDGTGCTTGTVTMSGARTCTAVFQALPCDPDGSLHQNCQTLGGTWNSATCSCSHFNQDPLLLALDGGALDLTDLAHGVRFDTDGDGVAEQIAWTTAGSRVRLLALDLNGNGVIETGAELFAGPPSGPIRGRAPTDVENSFTLLAAYDDPANGGNGDGVISAEDAVFGRLRFWIDTNHDGISQPEELVSLAEAGVVSIELTYQATGRRDGLGNYYRYRGIAHLTSGRHVSIWDVFLATEAPSGGQCPAAGGASEAAGGAARQQGDSASDWADTIEEDGPWVDEDGEAVASSASPALDGEPTPLQVVEYYHLDALGSVRAVTDGLGQVIARHDFLPFGEELAPQNPPADRRRFTGQERDFETGLDYFRARQLRTDLGRFTTPDPLTNLAWTDPTSGAANAYGYVVNNPLGFIDPTGAQGHAPPPGRAIPTFRSGVIVVLPKPSGYDPAQAQASFQEFVFTITYLNTDPVPQIGPERGSGGVGTSANNTLDKQLDCAGDTLKKNGIALALDAASLGVDAFGPEGQYAKMAVDMALSGAATVNSAVHDDKTGAAIGMASYLKAPIEAAAKREGWGWAKYIPVAGAFMDVYSAYTDITTAISDFRTCLTTR